MKLKELNRQYGQFERIINLKESNEKSTTIQTISASVDFDIKACKNSSFLSQDSLTRTAIITVKMLRATSTTSFKKTSKSHKYISGSH